MSAGARPCQVLDTAQMRAEEQRLIASGITESGLMARAGLGAADWVFRLAVGRAVSVLCGPGNNGGDGYVIARELHRRGVAVTVVAPLAPATAAARAARELYTGPVQAEIAGADGAPMRAGVLVDALFGTGLARPLAPELQAMIASLAARHDLRVAVDLPSGVASDDGALLNPGLPSFHLTLALGAWKPAHWLYPAAGLMGQRRLVGIGCGPVPGAAECLPRVRIGAPAGAAHKYSRGVLAVVAGAMPGASLLAARAAAHGGAGYVRLLHDPRLRWPPGRGCVPDELVVDDAPLASGLGDARIAAIVIGPGLGRDGIAAALLDAALGAGRPLVLDADALLLIGPGALAGIGVPVILTPHAGELARLFGAFGIGARDRRRAVADLAEASGAVVIAKGPDTLVQAPGAPCVFMPPAPSWLSTAGTGDVLAGLVASRLASGSPPRAAAIEGCAIHAEAARIAGAGLSAATLIAAIPAALADLADPAHSVARAHRA